MLKSKFMVRSHRQKELLIKSLTSIKGYLKAEKKEKMNGLNREKISDIRSKLVTSFIVLGDMTRPISTFILSNKLAKNLLK